MRKTVTFLLAFLTLFPALLPVFPLRATSQITENEPQFQLEQVYSIKDELDADLSEQYALLAANQDIVVYTNGNRDEDGYIRIFSNTEHRLVSQMNFPGENIFDAVIFNDGILFVRTPRGTFNDSRSETAQTIFTISHYSSNGSVSDLWTGQCIHPSALPRLQVLGGHALFAYDDLNASTLNQPEVSQTSRIGQIDRELNIHWLLSKEVQYKNDSSHFHFSNKSTTANFGHFPMLYSEGDSSIIYDYHAIDKTLDEIHLPTIKATDVFPLHNGELLLSIARPGTDSSFIYFHLDRRDQVTRIHVPASWELLNVLPIANTYLWHFEDEHDLLLLGNRPDELNLADVITQGSSSQIMRDYVHSFNQGGLAYLLAENASKLDIELLEIKDLDLESMPDHAILGTGTPRINIEELGSEIEKIMRHYDYDESVYGMLLSDTEGNILYEHRSQEPFTAASTVKIYALIWSIDAINEGLFTEQTPIAYYEASHYEGGTGSLQYTLQEGETRTVAELIELTLTESDNIAFHMIDNYRLNFADQIATFRMADLFDLAVTYDANVLTPNDLQKAYVYLYGLRNDPKVDKLLEIARDASGPALFPPPLASHKPGDVDTALADAGIYWNENSTRGPIYYSIMLSKTDRYEELFEDLSELIMEAVR